MRLPAAWLLLALGLTLPVARAEEPRRDFSIPQVDLMIGFQRDASPIPTRTMTVENLNRGLTSVSMGVRWRAAHWVTVGLTYMRTWADLLVLQDSVLNPPTNGKGHGSMSHVAADLLFHL